MKTKENLLEQLLQLNILLLDKKEPNDREAIYSMIKNLINEWSELEEVKRYMETGVDILENIEHL